MSFRKTLILILVLAAVGAYVFLYEMPTVEKNKETESVQKEIMPLQWDELDRIEVRRPAGILTLEKQEDSWKMTQPVDDVADSYPVTSLANAVRFGTVEKRLTETDKPLSDYGLENPRIIASFLAAGATKTLEVGNHYPIGGSLFVKLADSTDVLIVSDSLYESLNQEASQIREHGLFRKSEGTVVRLKIEGANQTLELEKRPIEAKDDQGDWEWRILSPFEALGDEKAVDDLVRKARDLTATAFLPPESADDPALGFSRPSVVVTLGTSTGKGAPNTEHFETVIIGKKLSNQDVYYASLDRGRIVVTLGDEGVRPLLVDASTLRDRHVARFIKENVQKMRLKISGTSAMITHADSEWIFEDGSGANEGACRRVLEVLAKMEGTFLFEGRRNLVKQYGIRSNSDSVSLFDSEDHLIARIAFGPTNTTLGSITVADMTFDDARVYHMAIEEIQDFPKTIDAFRAESNRGKMENVEENIDP